MVLDMIYIVVLMQIKHVDVCIILCRCMYNNDNNEIIVMIIMMFGIIDYSNKEHTHIYTYIHIQTLSRGHLCCVSIVLINSIIYI